MADLRKWASVSAGPFRFRPEDRNFIAVLLRDPETGELRPQNPNMTLDEVFARKPVDPIIVITREIVSPDGTRRPWRPWESPGGQ